MRKQFHSTLLILSGALVLAAPASLRKPPVPTFAEDRLDVNQDGLVTPADALAVIEYLNQQTDHAAGYGEHGKQPTPNCCE